MIQFCTGRLLISSPNVIGDCSFSRSVILLADCNEDGAVGFVVNRLLENITLDMLLPNINREVPIYFGGPVDTDKLYFLHTSLLEIEGSCKVNDDIYWGNDIEEAIKTINTHKECSNKIRFFLGYTGWTDGQLDEEIAMDSWIVDMQTDDQQIFNQKVDRLWGNKMKSMGDDYLLWSNAPDNPSHN